MADIRTALEYAKKNPNTPFATELRRRIQSGQMDTELQAAGIVSAPKESGFMAAVKDIPSDIKEAFTGATEAVSRGIEGANATRAQVESGEISPLAGTAKTIGGGLRAGAEVVGQGVMGLGKLFTSPESEKRVQSGVEGIAQSVVQAEPVQNLIQRYESLTPEQKALIDGTLGITEGLTTMFGVGPAARALRTGVSTATDIAGAGVRGAIGAAEKTVGGAIESVESAAKAAAPVVRGIADITGTAGDSIARIPQRVATNIGARRATREAISNLPTEIARTAARDGVDIADINTVYGTASKVDKNAARTLVKSVEDFAAGTSKADPIEAVGKPLVAKIKSLDKVRSEVGKQLGDVSENLGSVNKDELLPSVLDSLKRVQGLRGIKIGDNGKLDFSGTTLASELSTADQRAIQKAFSNAVSAQTGKQAHLFRQELFEVLGGKKKSLTNITDTQEKAFEAIRKGLSDVLESKNPEYRRLSNEYRKIIQPLNDMRKLMRAVPDATDDILDMQAGLLARRLTSTSISQGQLKTILKAIDNAVPSTGKTSVNVEALQDLYNVLNRYYDIAPKTGFQGLVRSGVESSRGIGSFVADTARELAGKSDAVRQKALKDIIDEALK